MPVEASGAGRAEIRRRPREASEQRRQVRAGLAEQIKFGRRPQGDRGPIPEGGAPACGDIGYGSDQQRHRAEFDPRAGALGQRSGDPLQLHPEGGLQKRGAGERLRHRGGPRPRGGRAVARRGISSGGDRSADLAGKAMDDVLAGDARLSYPGGRRSCGAAAAAASGLQRVLPEGLPGCRDVLQRGGGAGRDLRVRGQGCQRASELPPPWGSWR